MNQINESDFVDSPRLRFPRDIGNNEGAPVAMFSKRVQIIATVIFGAAIALGIAVLSVLAYTVYQGYQFDYANHKAMVQIIQYNLQQGNLKPVPPPTPTAPPAAPAASEPKK